MGCVLELASSTVAFDHPLVLLIDKRAVTSAIGSAGSRGERFEIRWGPAINGTPSAAYYKMGLHCLQRRWAGNTWPIEFSLRRLISLLKENDRLACLEVSARQFDQVRTRRQTGAINCHGIQGASIWNTFEQRLDEFAAGVV
jgi:hypothetical protein